MSRGEPQTPRIAVIIPCFNDGATVTESVESALHQEHCEIVVIDDGSTDPETIRTCDRLRAQGIEVKRQENQGLSAARMAGVAATSARYVYPIDADDRVGRGSLSALADALDRLPENVAAAWGISTSFGEIEAVYGQKVSTIDRWRVTHSAGIGYSAMYRREALLAVGGWSLDGPYEDWDLWMTLAERGYEGVRIPVRTLCYRVHGRGRMWSRALKEHDDILARLKSRHPALYASRRRAWFASREPWAVRLLFPIVGALPLRPPIRQRGYLLIEDPRRAALLARRQIKRRLIRTRRGRA